MTGNAWAVITGASSGIGKALALEFAARGYHVFLTGRNESALRTVAAECERQSKVQTRVHVADLANGMQADSLVAALAAEPLEFEILVNNAGFGINGDFVDTDLAAELDMVQVQILSMLKLTKALLPGMLSRRSGRILNVASVYSFAASPHQAVYGACKNFLLSFSTALAEETRGTGVTVTTLCPGVTQTDFRARAGIADHNKAAGISATAVARLAVIDTLRGDTVVIPRFINKLFVFGVRHLPIRVVARVVKFINRQRGVNE